MSIGYVEIALNNASGRQTVFLPSASSKRANTVLVTTQGNHSKVAALTAFTAQTPISENSRKMEKMSTAWEMMLASESILRRDWDSPEEDEAWADL